MVVCFFVYMIRIAHKRKELTERTYDNEINTIVKG